MRESKNCHHRFAIHEEIVAFMTDDGINLFGSGARFQKSISCGHTEFPVETDEMIEAVLTEKRNHPNSPKNIHLKLINI